MNQPPHDPGRMCPRCHGGNDPAWPRCQWCGYQFERPKSRAGLVIGALVAGGVALFALYVFWSTLTGGRLIPTRPPPANETLPGAFTGEGEQQTATFTLAGGDYIVDWTARDTGSSNVGCFHSADLKADSGSDRESVVITSPDGGQTKSGQANVHDVSGGRWYFDVISGCAWTLRIHH